MSGRRVARNTLPFVYRSIAAQTSALANPRPVMIAAIHCLVTPKCRAKAIFDPRGLSSKYSSNVMLTFRVSET
jgi:hypothetical protein